MAAGQLIVTRLLETRCVRALAMRSTIAASLCALVVAGSGIAEANKGNSTYLYKCGTYYPKAFFYKPWTWKYYKYAKYGYYVGDCKKTHSSNKTMDLNEAAPKYVGIQRVNKADTYLLDGPLSIYENGVAVPAPEEDDYFCTCECSTQEHSIGCVGFLLDSDGNPAFPILPLAGGNGTNTTGNGTVSGGYVFASVNGSNYVPTLRTFVPHFDDSYSHHAHLFFTGKSTSYVFTAEEGIIFGANGTNATNATNGTDGFAYIQAQMNSLVRLPCYLMSTSGSKWLCLFPIRLLLSYHGLLTMQKLIGCSTIPTCNRKRKHTFTDFSA